MQADEGIYLASESSFSRVFASTVRVLTEAAPRRPEL